jgi:hypothetical protein
MGTAVHISSLDRVSERVLDHLRQGHHTALVGSPGCGMTTFVADLVAKLVGGGFAIHRFDAQTKGMTELSRELAAARTVGTARQVVVLDHTGRLAPEDYRRLLASTTESVTTTGDLCLWCGNLDVRSADRQLGVKLCSVPSAHVSFPMLTRDDLLAVYVAIAGERGCRWGDAVLYLMLDLCGTDLALAKSATDYLHGDWSDRLYDESVWDRVQEWLKDDDTVDAYRTRLSALPSSCETTLALIRFGGKPQCLRAELIEEVDDGLRRLCLDGFIIPNLLPGFYQLRNLVVRFLLDESVQPELLFRRAANERAAALLQDTETMLRQVLASVFARIGADVAKTRLETMQQPGEVIDEDLNRAIMKWSRESCTEEARQNLVKIISEQRDVFKKAHSVWETAMHMMRQDGVSGDGSPHIQCIDYLTVDQLGQLVLWLKDDVFPRLNDDSAKKQRKEPRFRSASEPQDLIDNWREGVARVRRLRNQVAHLRNVGFQDMEDLTRTLERMRTDVIIYGGRRDGRDAPAGAAGPIDLGKE